MGVSLFTGLNFSAASVYTLEAVDEIPPESPL
jgi:hypothetical protein